MKVCVASRNEKKNKIKEYIFVYFNNISNKITNLVLVRDEIHMLLRTYGF